MKFSFTFSDLSRFFILSVVHGVGRMVSFCLILGFLFALWFSANFLSAFPFQIPFSGILGLHVRQKQKLLSVFMRDCLKKKHNNFTK